MHLPRDWFNISACCGVLSLVRLIVYLAFGLNCAVASAAVTCDQLANIAFTTEQLRNQGYSLPVVLAEADKLESSDRFTVAELDRIKGVVERVFNGSRSSLEILRECKENPPK